MMSRNYRDVFKLLESCVCDSALSAQEQQIYDVLGTITDDLHPDAHACRLKFFFVTYGCSDVMPYPFDLDQEYASYVHKIKLVSSYCRLSPDEEVFLTTHVSMEEMSIAVGNRDRLIRASFTLTFDTVSKKSPNRLFTAEYPTMQDPVPDKLLYNEPLDTNLLNTESDRVSQFLKKLVIGQYSRPEAFKGAKAIEFLVKIFNGEKDVGFFGIYELFTGTLMMQITSTDHSREIGSVLLYMLKNEHHQISGVQTVILRIMEAFPEFAVKMPPFEDRRKLKLPKLIGLDVFQAHVKVAAGHIVANDKELSLDKFAVKRTTAWKPSSSVQVG